MKRRLCIIVLFALALVPDWASACWPRWGSPADDRAYYVPIYHGPVYYAPQPVYGQPIYVQPCVPMYPPVLQPPRVEQAKPKAGASLAEPSRPIAQPTPTPPAPTKPPVVEHVRPASGVEVVPTKPETVPAKPEPAPAPPAETPRRGGLFEVPSTSSPEAKKPAERPKNVESIPPTTVPTEPKLPSLTEPKLPSLTEPKLPSLTEPKLPSLDAPKLPSLDLPKSPDPKASAHDRSTTTAVPVPAPPPDTLTPKLPDSLPPLTVPPDTPVTPLKPVEARSSPLSGAGRELKVNVFPASGAATADGSRKVGFYNHTNRDIALVIEGRSVSLPAMTYVHAQLPATFTWKCADKPAAQTTVPADATGLDVLIRE